jgi:hypothetical protein
MEEERVGFEPTDRFYGASLVAISGFADQRNQPLCHLSIKWD